MFRSEGNRLFFCDQVKDDVLPVCAALHNIIHKQGYTDVILDFSGATFLHPRFMLPLVTTARAYRSEKVDFDIIEPKDVKGANLIRNTDWAHLISPERYESRQGLNKNHLSAIQFLNADHHFSAVDKSMDVILRSISGLDRNSLKALEWSLNEITDNVLNHAESQVGGIVQVTTFPSKQIVEFYVCDAGIGIPGSLRKGRPDLVDNVSALRAAIEEGVTRNPNTNQGNGLFGTFKCCEVSGGEFEIFSANVSLRFKQKELRVSNTKIPFKGTFVRASINYGHDRLLEEALVFKGKVHNPNFDYLERVYLNHSDVIEFIIKEEINAFGSREAGQVARTKIGNLMDDGRIAVSFDFGGIHLISSSFADEVFGKLFAKLGAILFGQMCKFKNVDGTVQTLIDRAITQRLRQ